MEEEIAVIHKKVKILEIKQQSDVGNKPQRQKKLPASRHFAGGFLGRLLSFWGQSCTSMLHGGADALIDKQAAH